MAWKEFEEFKIEAHGLRVQVDVESGKKKERLGGCRRDCLYYQRLTM